MQPCVSRSTLYHPKRSAIAEETNEYPLSDDSIPLPTDLPALTAVQAPALDLSDLDDLQGTLQLLQEVGALD